MNNSRPAAKTATGPSPVKPRERIEFVDILRGLAVFGILVANMAGFSGRATVPSAFSEPLDQLIVNLSRFFIEAKFYSLFSFLFGWGMAYQLSRARARGVPFIPLYLRRMFILLIIGLLHGIFIWTGDILTLYAILGMFLILFRNLTPRKLLIASGLFLLLSIILTLPGEGMDAFRGAYEGATGFMRYELYPESLYLRGSYAEVTRLRLQEILGGNSWLIYYLGNVFAMFLLGLYAGKRHLFRDYQEHLPLLRRVLWSGLVIGGIFNAIFVWSTNHPDARPAEFARTIRVGSRTIGAPALMLFYVSGIILLVQKESWHSRLAPLGNVGRMALSNYLLQSVLISLIFYGYGLGLYGQVDPTFGLILTVVFFLLQIRWSAWWFDRYQYGPVEWIWRALTYGQVPPLHSREAGGAARGIPGAARLGAIFHRLPPLALLGGVWLLLLAWGVGLYTWAGRLPVPPAETGPRPAEAQDLAQAASAGEGALAPAAAAPLPLPEVQPLTYSPGPAAAAGDVMTLAEAFDTGAALQQIETLSSAAFQGRESGSPGGQAAGNYIASQFARYRLQPAGDDGTFFQSFPVHFSPLAAPPEMGVWDAAGEFSGDYDLYQDFSPLVRMYAGEGVGEGDVVWVNSCQQEAFDAIDLVGKVAFCEAGAFGREPHIAGRRALEHGAVGLLLLTDPAERPPDFGDTYADTWVPEPLPALRVFPPLAEDLLDGTNLTLEDLRRLEGPRALETRARLAVDLVEDACPREGCLGRNVLGVIPGRDPAYADEVVILGAHYDHLGQGPEGTYWAGANDNASGIAVMLEILRIWDEQGYVPRRTVLFAAWDAEEKGLLGSQHYVDNPRYPLESTIAALKLDMVGAGAEVLAVNGEAELSAHLLRVAEALDIPARTGSLGRSDHVPFLNAGVPASLMIWWDDENTIPHYHRPADTLTAIELTKLNAAGQLAGLSLLDLVESEPAIKALLRARLEAMQGEDLAAFLATSTPQLQSREQTWFASLQALRPEDVSLEIEELSVNGPTATADLALKITYPNGEDAQNPRQMTLLQEALLRLGPGGWRYAGPNLVYYTPPETPEDGPASALAIAHPPGLSGDWQALSQAAGARYAEFAGLLGLTTEPDTTLALYKAFEDLKASTSLLMPEGQRAWITSSEARMVYSPELAASPGLDAALVQLLLAQAGVSENHAPWLWEGLPLAIQAREDPLGTQIALVPKLAADLESEEGSSPPAESWAATTYLVEALGWQGLGSFIQALGARCATGECGDRTAVEQVIQESLNQGNGSFEAAWRAHWQTRLREAQAALDELTASREQAIQQGDQAAFLATVDPAVPRLLEEETSWYLEAIRGELSGFSLHASPLAWLGGGQMLAAVDMDYTFAEAAAGKGESLAGLQVVMSPGEEGYLWAGPLLETLDGERVMLRYPPGQAAVAAALQESAAGYYRDLSASLGFAPREKLVISLYPETGLFRASIGPRYPAREWITAWTGNGQSIKLQLRGGDIGEDASGQEYLPSLYSQMGRHFLMEAGVSAEWLLEGLSLYLTGQRDGGQTQRALNAALPDLLTGLENRSLYSLGGYPGNGDRAKWAKAQAWDSVGYLEARFGWGSLLRLIHEHGQGAPLDKAVATSLGISLEEFERDWRESLKAGHLQAGWETIAARFDPGQAMEHLERLTDPILEGRRAGSSGDQAAAVYIAGRFRDYGLVPAGDPDRSGGDGNSYFQLFVISDTVMTEAPRLELRDPDGMATYLLYREDFLPLRTMEAGSGTASGPLVWVDDGDFEALALTGEIIIRRPNASLDEELNRALEVGAGGLLLVGPRHEAEEILAKDPKGEGAIPQAAIPVFELTRAGYKKFLAAIGQESERPPETSPGEGLGVAATLAYLPSPIRQLRTANVLGLLPGSDPFLRQEVIILGAHYDHVGDDPPVRICRTMGDCELLPGLRYPGANDNASGVGVLLEIARLWHETGYRPQRSVLFAAFGAEELGQLGSLHFIQHPALPMENARGVIILDGVGGGDGFYLGSQGEWDQAGWLLLSLEAAASQFEEKVIRSPNMVPGDQGPFREDGHTTLLVHWRLAGEANLPEEYANGVSEDRLGVTGRLVSLALMGLAQ